MNDMWIMQANWFTAEHNLAVKRRMKGIYLQQRSEDNHKYNFKRCVEFGILLDRVELFSEDSFE